MSSTSNLFTHPDLGQIQYLVPPTHPHLTRFLNIPYGEIPERFARSTVRDELGDGSGPYVATRAGPSSVQPRGSAKMDAEGLQLPTDEIEDGEGEWQSETDCLQLSITLPKSKLDTEDGMGVKKGTKLPVLVFLHGGAFFLGSGDRSYYNPSTFMAQPLESPDDIQNAPRSMLFVAANYRLGAHGFMHSFGNSPPNNGLHDQVTLFRWIHKYISGFGGDAENITLMGQSAGEESVSLHNLARNNGEWKPYRRSIMFSGSPLCMPAKTPEEHEANFRELAGKMMGDDKVEDRSSEDLMSEMRRGGDEWEDKLRDLAWVGAPCSQSEMMPYETPSLALLQGLVPAKMDEPASTGEEATVNSREDRGKEDGPSPRFGRWMDEQLVSWCGFDGGISYTMIKSNRSRKDHARRFRSIVRDVLVDKHGKAKEADQLLTLYGLQDRDGSDKKEGNVGGEREDIDDDEALRQICLFESDLGFFAPCLAEAQGTTKNPAAASLSSRQSGETNRRPRTVLQLFDLGNPFEGPITPGQFATHTWDVVALLGAYEHRLDPDVKKVVQGWRDRIIDYVCTGGETAGLPEWTEGSKGEMVVVNSQGWEIKPTEEVYGKGTRRGEVLRIAKGLNEVWGQDILWNDVCRRFLMKGE